MTKTVRPSVFTIGQNSYPVAADGFVRDSANRELAYWTGSKMLILNAKKTANPGGAAKPIIESRRLVELEEGSAVGYFRERNPNTNEIMVRVHPLFVPADGAMKKNGKGYDPAGFDGKPYCLGRGPVWFTPEQLKASIAAQQAVIAAPQQGPTATISHK